MSASFYDLLKYAATGIASPSMTYYDKLRASTLMGGYPERSITGEPPLIYDCKKEGYLTAWSISGNGVQDGTPSPSNIVPFDGSGSRTGNLLSEKYENRSINGRGAFTIDSSYDLWLGEVVSGQTYTISNMDAVYGFFTAKPLPNTGTTYDGSRGYELSGTAVVTVPSGCTWIAVRVLHNADNAMLNSGSTALPYEPFGYKLTPTITSGTDTQTVPIYLGQTQTVRRVRKRVFDGTEGWSGYSSGASGIGASLLISDMLSNSRDTGFCTHFSPQYSPVQSGIDGITFGAGNKAIYITFSAASASALNITDTVSFKSYLAAQYAAGTPVTVWYVLATPETAIVNEPLAKIGDYADELHSADAGVSIPTAKGNNVLTIDTTLQPSEMTITFKG